MNSIIFLGTNGWYDSITGNTISILIKTPKYSIVLDAGNGFAKFGNYHDFKTPLYLFISHFHLDHTEGLHTLNKNPELTNLFLLTGNGQSQEICKFLSEPYTVPLSKLPFPAEVMELPRDGRLLPFKSETLKMKHSVDTTGINLSIDDKLIAYCPDTGYCDNAVKIAAGSDILITECAFTPGENSLDWPHLNPESAARIALESGTKKLILTHFDAARYTDESSRKKAETTSRKIFKNTFASYDGMVINF